MKIFSQGSFISSFVLVVSLFDGLNAAKIVPVSLSPAVIAQVTQAAVTATGSATAVNVFNTLLEFYNTNPDLFQNISDIYNNFKAGKIPNPNIPADLYGKIPANVASILCVKNGDLYQLNPVVCSTLDLLLSSIKDGIDAVKSKTCKACCQVFWCQTAPKILLMSVQLLGPVLAQIAVAKAAATKSELPQEPILLRIPEHAIAYNILG